MIFRLLLIIILFPSIVFSQGMPLYVFGIGEPSGSEILPDPDFSDYTGTSPNVDFTEYQERENSGGADFSYDNGGKMTVTSAPTNYIDLGFGEGGISLTSGKTYFITATIEASSDYPVDVNIRSPNSGIILRTQIESDEKTRTYVLAFEAEYTEDHTIYIWFRDEPAVDDYLIVKELSLKER